MSGEQNALGSGQTGQVYIIRIYIFSIDPLKGWLWKITLNTVKYGVHAAFNHFKAALAVEYGQDTC